MHPQQIRDNLKTLADTLSGPFRKHAHEKHHRAIDSYVRFIDVLVTYIEHLEKSMSKISDALNKRTAERDAWKTYANGLQPQVEAAKAAQNAAEDALAAIPIIPDAGDVTAVDDVIAAADDLPPTDVTPTPEVTPTPGA